MTVDTGPTRWLTSEFGAALALAIVATALLFWRARGAIEKPNELILASLTPATRAQAVAAGG